MPFLKKLQMMWGRLAGKPMVDCDNVLEQLFEYLDGELGDPQSQEIQAHLEVCKRCYPRAEFERTFLEALQKAQSGEACPEAVRENILAAIQEGA